MCVQIFLLSILYLKFSTFCQWIISHMKQRSAHCFLCNSKNKRFLLENSLQALRWLHQVLWKAHLWLAELSAPGLLHKHALTLQRSHSKWRDNLLENSRFFNTKGEPGVSVGGGVGDNMERRGTLFSHCESVQPQFTVNQSLCYHFYIHYLIGPWRRSYTFPPFNKWGGKPKSPKLQSQV